MKTNAFLLIFLLGIGTFVFFPACKKKKVGKAVITVVDSLNQPVFQATVNLNTDNSNPPGIVKDKKITDNNGKTYHEFPLEVILQVEASKGSKTAPKNNIHVVPGETAALTVKLK